MTLAPPTTHGTCVALGGLGFLLLGPSGAGKSDLALRLIDRGGELVADDRVAVEARADTLWASAPEPLRGRLEVRGLGILTLPVRAEAPLAAAIALQSPVPRLPEPSFWDACGLRVPVWPLAPFEASAPAKLAALARTLAGEIGLHPDPGTAQKVVERPC